MVSNTYKKIFLRKLASDAEDAGESIYDALVAAGSARIEQTAAGLILSTAGNNQSVTFASPGDGFTQTDLAEMCEELITLHDEAKASLIANDSIPSPNDAQILAEMIALLKPVYEAQANFGGLQIVGRRW